MTIMENAQAVETEPQPGVSVEFLRAIDEGARKPGERTVLIIDDDPAVRGMLASFMGTLDGRLRVHEAENGRQGLDVLGAIRKSTAADPVLIVLDLQMPVMDGWDFIDELWEECEAEGRRFGIPVIVLSASTGSKGIFGGKSVHGKKCKYAPLATIAKEDCIKPIKYASRGEAGLVAWLKYFLK